VEAFAQIAKDFPDWKVELYGLAKYKDYNEEINSFIKAHGLENQVCLAGYAKDMEALYRSADIQAFPSACEGFSLAIADAMSIGLPHIGFKDAHSVNEIIVDGHNGFLADDVDDFAQKLRKLIEDKNLCIEFGKNAHEDMKAYAPEVIMQQWNELFKKITA
jgi:glycosyltransferase involved in cell wall biosynthesis